MSPAARKFRKLVRQPSRFFYDFFRKRVEAGGGELQATPVPKANGKGNGKPKVDLIGDRNILDAKAEAQLFAAAVEERRAAGEPVKIHCGFRHIPREDGWINLDKWLHADSRPFVASHPKDVFIFPFADWAWPIPDNSVDYVFHEDFIEHIPQKLQVMFLAETLRVLKPGAWHRVNTPCLLSSMRKHSDFSKGSDGVYQGEWDRWGHRAIFTNQSLEELATLIGYSEVVFNGKNQSVSEHRTHETRPKGDRDAEAGNVFADLKK